MLVWVVRVGRVVRVGDCNCVVRHCTSPIAAIVLLRVQQFLLLNGIKSRLVILLAIVLTKYFAIHHTITHHRPYPPPDPTQTKLAYLHCISFLQREGQSW